MGFPSLSLEKPVTLMTFLHNSLSDVLCLIVLHSFHQRSPTPTMIKKNPAKTHWMLFFSLVHRPTFVVTVAICLYICKNKSACLIYIYLYPLFFQRFYNKKTSHNRRIFYNNIILLFLQILRILVRISWSFA